MINRPEGFSGDQTVPGLGRRGAGRRVGGSIADGVQSIGTRVRALRSCGAYGEFRRLTIRGERLAVVRTARVAALAASSSRNQR
jgi:hypothetical protein